MDTRIVDEAMQLSEIINRALSRINTSIPGIIHSFNRAKQTATVQPAVSMKTFIDGKSETLEFPLIVNAPIVFPFAMIAGFALTIPIQKGDPCILLFSQRAIDNWHDKGGVQPSEEGISSRHHDLTDAVVLLAASPVTGVLPGWEDAGIQLRDRAAHNKITVFDNRVEIESNVKIDIKASNLINITSNDKVNVIAAGILELVGESEVKISAPIVTINGNLSVVGTSDNNGINVGNTHIHPQGSDSDGDTQQNTGVPQ